MEHPVAVENRRACKGCSRYEHGGRKPQARRRRDKSLPELRHLILLYGMTKRSAMQERGLPASGYLAGRLQ